MATAVQHVCVYPINRNSRRPIRTHASQRPPLPSLADLSKFLCQVMLLHDEKYSESNPMTDAEVEVFEEECALNGGACDECRDFAIALLGEFGSPEVARG